jgi:hypothetical protein
VILVKVVRRDLTSYAATIALRRLSAAFLSLLGNIMGNRKGCAIGSVN